MGKRIAFCADGTWNAEVNRSNVYRLYKSLEVSSDQLSFYDDGIGVCGRPIEKLIGGAFGTGIWQKIKDGYTQFAHAYEEGDELFIFGFSRGAYTARSVAGMIAACGLPTQHFTDDVVETAFAAYRDKQNRQKILRKLDGCNMYPAKIRMVGVWDTVGALGIPALFGGVDPIAYGFLDTDLHSNVLNAYHALAIDERRCEFRPTLWTGMPAAGQIIEQVWFCGVHGDVGGGQPDALAGIPALSDITLHWMMSKAAGLGLGFDAEIRDTCSTLLGSNYALATLHDSWSFVCGPAVPRTIDPHAALANSVKERFESDRGWRPENLRQENGMLASSYSVVPVVGDRPVPSVVAIAS